MLKNRRKQGRLGYVIAVVEHSPLRSLDPRTKLVISLCASLLIMLPLGRLALAMIFYAVLVAWAKLGSPAARQVWRLRWVLLLLFGIDWWLIGLVHAVEVLLRLVLLAGVFSLFFSTTTTGEFRQAMEKLGVPYRLAFSIGLAFQSLQWIDEELRAIREAQKARGIYLRGQGLRAVVAQTGDLVALTVPAVVLATRRAWSLTEAAYARGFNSPRRRPFRPLVMRRVDWAVVAASVVFVLGMNLGRW